MQRVLAPGMCIVLGEALLLRRMRRECVSRDRLGARDIRTRLRAFQKAYGMCDHAEGRRGNVTVLRCGAVQTEPRRNLYDRFTAGKELCRWKLRYAILSKPTQHAIP